MAEPDFLDTSSMAEIGCADAPVVRVAGASYVRGGYRSFEFADVEAHAGQVTALLSGERAFARDLLLAVAGAVRPTSGSIAVGEAEFTAQTEARPLRGVMAWDSFQRQLRATSAVGLGVFTGLTEVNAALTVEEAVAHELGYRRGTRADVPDPLDFLATLGLATYADQRIERLHPDARARLSAALALAPVPHAVAVDLRDPFCAGLTAAEERAIVCDMRGVARATGAVILVCCAEASSSAEADAVFTLDIAAAEALAASDLLSATQPVSEGVDA